MTKPSDSKLVYNPLIFAFKQFEGLWFHENGIDSTNFLEIALN